MARWKSMYKSMYKYRGKGMSVQAQLFIGDRIRGLMRKGCYTHDQAIAMAYSDARNKGYKVPKYPLKKWKI